MQLPTRLSQRSPNANKGNFGHIFILAGSKRFSGAAVLCAEAAMRSGAGLVTLGIPKGINNAIIRIKLKEVMTLPLPETKEGTLSISGYKKINDFIKKVDLVVIGPGLGTESSTQALVRKLINEIDKPLVLDADGLNALIGNLGILLKPNTKHQAPSTKHLTPILTPHPGEMARLIGKSIAVVQKNRIKITKSFAKKFKVALALKGHNTVVADYRGNCYINKTGNPGMSSAGCGDVLTGIIAAFLGQGLDAFNSAKYGVYLHGLAGDLAAKEKSQLSMLASDIINKLPEAIKKAS